MALHIVGFIWEAGAIIWLAKVIPAIVDDFLHNPIWKGDEKEEVI